MRGLFDGSGQKNPAGHAEQNPSPANANEPVGQACPTSLGVLQAYPAGQTEQFVDAGRENLP